MPKQATRPKSDKGSRAARSGFQGGLVALLIMLINAFIDPDLTTEQVGVISVVALPVFSYLMNALEDASGVAVISKRPAAETLTAEEIAAVRTALASRPEPRIRTEQIDALPRVETFRG